jgi:hypothetical protein
VLVAVGVVLAVVGGGWLTWAVWLQSTPQVQSGLVRSRVLDAHRVSADIEVDFGTRHVVADCLLQALAVDHSVVGELNFRVPAPGAPHPAQVTVHRTLRTERRATVVNLVGCTTPEQKQPR